MLDHLIMMCLVAVAVGTVTVAVTHSHLFRPIRHAMIDAPFMLGELFACPFCLSFWMAVPAAVSIGGPIGAIIVNWLILSGLASLYAGILLKVLLFREAENEELREMLRESRQALKDLMEDIS